MGAEAPRSLFVAGIVVVLAMAGCGGSENAAEQVSRLTKAQLVQKGTAICDQGNKQIAVGRAPYLKSRAATGKTASRKELDKETAQVVLPVRKVELQRLRGLGMPKKGAPQFQTMLAAMEEGIETGEQNHHLLLAPKVRYAFREASEVGIRFGLVNCWLG
jgi:hypothetical protein